jgi:hypothetical protein
MRVGSCAIVTLVALHFADLHHLCALLVASKQQYKKIFFYLVAIVIVDKFYRRLY